MTYTEANDQVILVDDKNQILGTMGKKEVHEKGLLHRAISVFIFNDKGELLLQKRAKSKYHSGGLWTNTCCSHPRPNEEAKVAAERRLIEEMGFHTKLEHKFSFQYEAKLDNGFIENEYDLVFFGYSNDIPSPNPEEVEGWAYIGMEEIADNIISNPNSYTEWFKICFEKVQQEVSKLAA